MLNAATGISNLIGGNSGITHENYFVVSPVFVNNILHYHPFSVSSSLVFQNKLLATLVKIEIFVCPQTMNGMK